MKKNLLLLTLFISALGYANENPPLTQTIRGRVSDSQSETSLPGVSVFVIGAKLGTISNMDGYYVLEDVPVGRVSIGFSFIGYEPVRLQNVELSGSKEMVLNVTMRETTEQLDEVVVQADQQKERVQNELVTVSGRTFSIEESMRFAGSIQDVSRMAANFAGVQRSNDAVNDIVIRGNSPLGLIWRLEGIDIPNPNHFGGLGATGGPVSMLNNNVLANSDFLTGAFPSEYGDGVSGVFDLQMRNGNYEEHEFLGQIGFNGLEAGAEGPINREKRSSYLLNYRYSTLGVLSKLGMDFGTGTAVPYYQDLNMKLHFPSRKYGTIEVFALGGISSIEFLDSENEEGEDGGFYSDEQDLRNRVKTGVLGASHQYFFNKDLYSKVTLAASSATTITKVDTADVSKEVLTPIYRQNFMQNDLQFNGYINKKFSARHVLRTGAFVTLKNYALQDSALDVKANQFHTLHDHNANDMLYQPYVNWQFRPSDRWEMNTGLHAMILQSSGNYSIEPRFGASYHLSNTKSISVGYGLHSQIPPVTILYDRQRSPDGSYTTPNEDMGFTKSHHFVVGYDQMFAKRIRFKAETYYQYIYDAVVEQHPSSLSSLNTGSFDFGVPDSVENGGKGYNYGLDLTLEKFMDKGIYFLSTLSLYQSKYQGSDEIWRNTAFNGNYVWNLLGGKEFVLGRSNTDKKSRSTITLDGKITWAGGQRYTPLDVEASIAAGEERYDRSKAYGEQYAPYFRADIRIGYKISGQKVTQEWALDIQNLTNHENPFGQDWDPVKKQAFTTYQLGLFPMFLYRITF